MTTRRTGGFGHMAHWLFDQMHYNTPRAVIPPFHPFVWPRA